MLYWFDVFELGGTSGGGFRMVFFVMMRGTVVLMIGIWVVDSVIDMLGP